MMLGSDAILADQKPDFVMTEESILHDSYPDMFSLTMQQAIYIATRRNQLVTGFVKKRDEISGNEAVYLIKWQRVS